MFFLEICGQRNTWSYGSCGLQKSQASCWNSSLRGGWAFPVLSGWKRSEKVTAVSLVSWELTAVPVRLWFLILPRQRHGFVPWVGTYISIAGWQLRVELISTSENSFISWFSSITSQHFSMLQTMSSLTASSLYFPHILVTQESNILTSCLQFDICLCCFYQTIICLVQLWSVFLSFLGIWHLIFTQLVISQLTGCSLSPHWWLCLYSLYFAHWSNVWPHCFGSLIFCLPLYSLSRSC